MSEGPPGSGEASGPGRAAFRRKGAELGVALFFFLIGAIVIVDSARLGIV